MRLALVCFYCLCVFVYVLYFIATMSFAGYFLSVLFCMLSMLISDSRLDLVWFRLSCDHGWIRSGSVDVRKQQQQQQLSTDSKNRARQHSLPARGRSARYAREFSFVTCLVESVFVILQGSAVDNVLRTGRSTSPAVDCGLLYKVRSRRDVRRQEQRVQNPGLLQSAFFRSRRHKNGRVLSTSRIRRDDQRQ